MQELIKLFFLLTILVIPLNSAKAISRNFNSSDLNVDQIVSSSDDIFQLIIDKDEYDSLKVHIFKSNNIYSYYYISPQINEDSKFDVTFKTDLDEVKQIYEWNSKKNDWTWVPTSYDYDNNLLKATLQNRKGKLKLFAIKKIETTGQNIVFSDSQLELILPKTLDGDKITTKIEVANELVNNEFKRVSPIYDIQLTSDLDLSESLSNNDTPFVCEPYLNNYIDDFKTNYGDVVKLQQFLKTYENYNLIADGDFDSYTKEAINKFQEKYASEILEPWGLTEGTGNIYKTSLKKINQIYCDSEKDKNSFIEIKLKYLTTNNSAKSIYYLNNNEWQQLASYDNHENNVVTALTKLTNLKIALFEDNKAWVGEASWYAWKGGNFAASRDFPKGTKLRVTNQSNSSNRGKSVIITVNDYGPELWTGRIIDLDKVAYDSIGNLKGGVMPVKVELIEE